MQRILLQNTKFSEILEITEKELYHQLTRVLRARVDQQVIFFDGINLEDHLYVMVHINKNTVSFRKEKVIEKSSELQNALTLYQALPNKLSKLETIVQKCSEVGYKKIIFFESERSQKLILSENKKLRLQKISIEAVELCSGNIVPEIDYREDVIKLEEGISLLCHTQGENSQSLGDTVLEDSVNIIVGPEGGLSEKEVEKFENLGVQKIYFGNRILRCETVGEVVGFYLSQKK